MRAGSIDKDIGALPVMPNLQDHAQVCAGFSWDAMRRELAPQQAGRLNIAWQAVWRHAQGPRANHIALRWLGRDGHSRDVSYAELAELCGRFAAVLQSLGIGKGDHVFLLLPRVVELHVALLGALQLGAVVTPLFSAFGPEPIATRMSLGKGKVLVTTEALYQRKVAGIREQLPALQQVLLAGAVQSPPPGTLALASLMDAAVPLREEPATSADDDALLHFTSGTTGTPKGAAHVHGAVLMHYMTGKYALDLHRDDIFWCTADPGWVTGTSYGVIAPLLHGVTSIIDEADFDAQRWYRILQEQNVSVWYTAPTALRMLMKGGAQQHMPAAGHAHESPYVGEEGRAIKSLSEEDIAELRRGGGWGLAKAVELNGVPGPAHLLELRDEIGLSGEQVAAIQAIFDDMQRKAIAEGEQLIAREQALEDLFRAGTVTDATLRDHLQLIEASRRELRYIHLSAHLTTPPLLSDAQLAQYRTLRGYGDDPCANVPAGHDPAMWRQHNGCR